MAYFDLVGLYPRLYVLGIIINVEIILEIKNVRASFLHKGIAPMRDQSESLQHSDEKLTVKTLR